MSLSGRIGASVTNLEKALEGLSEEQIKEIRLEASLELQKTEKMLIFKMLFPPSFGGALGVLLGSLAVDLVFGWKGFSFEAVSILTLFGGFFGAIGGFVGFRRYNAMLLPFISQVRQAKNL